MLEAKLAVSFPELAKTIASAQCTYPRSDDGEDQWT